MAVTTHVRRSLLMGEGLSGERIFLGHPLGRCPREVRTAGGRRQRQENGEVRRVVGP